MAYFNKKLNIRRDTCQMDKFEYLSKLPNPIINWSCPANIFKKLKDRLDDLEFKGWGLNTEKIHLILLEELN